MIARYLIAKRAITKCSTIKRSNIKLMPIRSLRAGGVLAATFATLLFSLPAQAMPCGGDFNTWVAGFKREAASKGISSRALVALDGVTESAQVLSLDRRQGVFSQSFETFSGKRIAERINKARGFMKQYASTLRRIEDQFGVPGGIVIAIWGLETDFGVSIGKQPAIRSLATLAHDCRRTDMFQRELLAALTILDRGDLTQDEMRGAWAGELGQTQFLPSNYTRFAVDYDGDGRRDLIRSRPDVLASTANYLKGYGWQRGQPWDEGTPNFAVLRQWNRALVYSKTIAEFANRLERGQ
jgi:lytic murein transglycosylase